MRTGFSLTRIAPVVAIIVATLPAMATAQSDLFSPSITVNGAGISNFEIEQRVLLLQSLNTTGDLRALAESALIDERIYMQEAKRLKVEISPETVAEGMNEYAARANLTTEQFLVEVGKFGVAPETFEIFVEAGLAWREVVSGLFGGIAAELQIEDVDEKLDLAPQRRLDYAQILEIVVPLDDSNRERALEVGRQVQETVTTAERFSEIARSISRASTSEAGGDAGWILLDEIPPVLATKIAAAPVGDVIAPTVLNNTLFIFFKRDERSELSERPRSKVDFATVSGIPDRQQAERLVNRSPTCNDLLFESKLIEGAAYVRQSQADADGNARLSNILAGLDRRESRILMAEESGAAASVIMLCERKADVDETIREIALQQLRTRKLEDYARSYLADLRARAIILR